MASDLLVTAVQAKCSAGVLKKDVWQHVHNVRPNPKPGLARIWNCNYCGAGDDTHDKDMSVDRTSFWSTSVSLRLGTVSIHMSCDLPRHVEFCRPQPQSCLDGTAKIPPGKLAQLKQIADEHLRVIVKRQHDDITREADRDKEIEHYAVGGFNLEELRSCRLMPFRIDTASSVADSSPAAN